MAAHGVKNWVQIATELHMRNGKQCRERWRNHLRPELNKGDWTQEEDVAIWSRVQQLGTKRAQISLPRYSLDTSWTLPRHQVGADLGAVHAAPDRQRHQEPVELDRPQELPPE